MDERRGRRKAHRKSLIAIGVLVAAGATVCATLFWTSMTYELPISQGGGLQTSSNSAPEAIVASREELDVAVTKQSAMKQFGALPILFVQNDGQWPAPVKFGARGHAVSAALTDRGITLSARVPKEHDEGTEEWHAVALNFCEEGRALDPIGEKKVPGVHNYLIGNDSSKWRTGVPLYEAVRYDDVAPGIAMVVTDRKGVLEYDLHVEPGADVGALEVTCDGADSVSVDDDGALALETKAGVLRQTAPKAWFVTQAGEEKVADCRFRMTGPSSYGFAVLNPDPSSKLIVDPGLIWSTYLGGSGDDVVTGVDFDAGFVTVVGYTDGAASPVFPTTTGAFDTSFNLGTYDAFATRFDPSQPYAAELVWSTFIGGSGDDKASGVAVSSNGSVAICGDTDSTNFPVSTNAFQSTLTHVDGSAFVFYLDPSASGLAQRIYGTYYGGFDGGTNATALAIDSAPIITIVGYTVASTLQCSSTTSIPPSPWNAYDNDFGGSFTDAFVAQFDPSPTATVRFLYGSYIGGLNSGVFGAADEDRALCVALESSTVVYIGGWTKSTDFETANNLGTGGPVYLTANNVGTIGFLMKLKPSDTMQQLKYATYLGPSSGGTSATHVLGLTAHLGVFYASGFTTSSTFPTSVGGTTDEAPAFRSTLNGVDDAIVVKLNPSLSPQMRYSTYYGGVGVDWAYSLQRVSSQSVVFFGRTQSNNLPMSAPPFGYNPFASTISGFQDAFLARLRWSPLPGGGPRLGAAQLDYSTFIGGATTVSGGGADAEAAYSVVLDGFDAYFGGQTNTTDYPTAGTPYDLQFNGAPFQFDGIVGNLSLPPFFN